MGNLRGVMGNDVIKGKLSIGKGEQGEQGDTGKSIEYNWRGTELGIRQEGTTEYEYVDLKGESSGTGTGDTHRHMNKAELDKITIGDVAKWNNYTPTWEQIEGKPGNFNPSTHRHNASEIDGLSGGGGGLTPEQATNVNKIPQIESDLEHNTTQLEEHLANHPQGGGTVAKTFNMCETPIPLPTSQECDGQVTHPSAIAVPSNLYSAFKGAKYLLAVTPLPYYNISLENPTLFGTINHKDFFAISNGFIDTPSSTSSRTYLSDPCLVFNGSTLECWYREADEVNITEKIYRKTSTNGVNWSERELLIETSNGQIKNHLSPAVLYEDGIYKIWTNSNGKINYYTSTTGTNWQFVKQFIYENWHFSVKHTTKGYEVVNCSSDNNFHYGVFDSEVDWDRSKSSVIITKGKLGNIADGGIYHGSFVEDSGQYYVYFGANSIDNRWNTCLMQGTHNNGTLDLTPVNFFDNPKFFYATESVNTKTLNAKTQAKIASSTYSDDIRLYSAKGTVRLYNNDCAFETTNKFNAASYGLVGDTNRMSKNGEGRWAIGSYAIQTTLSGTTVNRPVRPNLGLMYFDTTIKLPIWWNGTEWIKSDGTNAGGTSVISVTGVSLNKNTTSIVNGNVEQLTATIAPSSATNKNVTWISSNSNVATVSNAGLITTVGDGNTIITVTTQDGNKTATCDVTVTSSNVPVTGISLNKATSSLYVGKTEQLTVNFTPSDVTNRNIAWSTSDSTKATVSSDGLVDGLAVGNVNITATSQDGNHTASCAYTIEDNPFPNAVDFGYEVSSDSTSSYNQVTKVLNLISDGAYKLLDIKFDVAKFPIGQQFNLCYKILNRNLETGHALSISSTWNIVGKTFSTTNLVSGSLNTVFKESFIIQEGASGKSLLKIVFNSGSATNSTLKAEVWIEPVS